VAPQGHFFNRIMHLALPSRKSSNPPQYAPRSPRFPIIRRSRIQAAVVGTLVVGSIIWLLSRLFGGGDGIPSGSPPVVILTVVDEVNYSKEYIKMIKDNRIEYAKKHGKFP
jgi:mannan polymerase II complex MNN11 subunit